MVTEVRINNNNTPFPYACNLPAFKKGQTYTFKEGVNIIVGENGCGKSTLLNIIKAYLTIENIQCGRGMFNHCINSLYSTFGQKQLLNGADVYADYERNSFSFLEIKDQDEDFIEKEKIKSVKNAEGILSCDSYKKGWDAAIKFAKKVEEAEGICIQCGKLLNEDEMMLSWDCEMFCQKCFEKVFRNKKQIP